MGKYPPAFIIPGNHKRIRKKRHDMTRGVTVSSVTRGSPFFKAGLRKGDTILAINNEPIFDELDFHFFIAEEQLHLVVKRGTAVADLRVERAEGDFSGVALVEQPIRRCSNRCIFCFIDQMPPGLRRSLYVKDEDVRLSVFNGNYVTLSNFTNADLDHLGKIGLSPLYISVHATDPAVRRRMLRNKKTPPIMDQLRRLAKCGIRFHTQIVVCPEWNDGTVLTNTVRDLLKFRDAVLSVAVVPVGLTRFRSLPITPVDALSARKICGTIGRISDRNAVRDGERKVFLADEFFIKAGLPIPGSSYYEEYPQIENGVGLVRQLLDGWNTAFSHFSRKKDKGTASSRTRRKLLITSVSAFPYIKAIVDEFTAARPDVLLEVTAVSNRFFGETVTVAGLLTAADIIGEIRRRSRRTSIGLVLLPSVIFNYAGYTLDGYSAHRIGKTSGIAVRVLERIEELENL